MSKQETIDKYKDKFKQHVKSMGVKWNEDNFVVYHKDKIIYSEDIEIDDNWRESNGYVEKENKTHNDDCGCCNEYLVEGMYEIEGHRLIADTYDSDHVGEYYGDYWFSMDNW